VKNLAPEKKGCEKSGARRVQTKEESSAFQQCVKWVARLFLKERKDDGFINCRCGKRGLPWIRNAHGRRMVVCLRLEPAMKPPTSKDTRLFLRFLSLFCSVC